MKENIENILKKLNDREFIKELSEFIQQEVNGKISMGFPKQKNREDKLYFLIDMKKEASLHNINEIELKLAKKLDYRYNYEYAENIEDEDELITLNRKLYSEKGINNLVKDITELSIENFSNIEKFLIKNYPNLFNKKDNRLLGEKTLSDYEKIIEDITLHLKKNYKLWKIISEKPEILSEIKREIELEKNKGKEEIISQRMFSLKL